MPVNDLNTAVAGELETARRVAGLTQGELASRAGLSLRSVQRYLDGSRPIKVDDLAAMAYALGSDPAALFATAARVHRND